MTIASNIQVDISKVKGRKTKLFRDIAKAYKKDMSSLDLSEVYTICEMLLKTRKRLTASFGFFKGNFYRV